MPKTKISEFSATPANNTDIDSINIAEGCAPSGINDAIRELMAQLKDFQTGAVGDSFNGPVGTTTAAAGAFTTLSASGAVTLSGGTANGVAYLNGSKVVTSGSALTFDGTNFGLGTASPTGATNYSAMVLNGTTGGWLRLWSSGTPIGSIFANASDGLNVETATATPIIFKTNGSEGMRLTSTGLGIGTSSPTSKLTVVGTVKSASATQSSFYLSNAAQTNGFLLGRSLSSDDAQNFFIYDTVAAATRLYLDSSGNLGLGVTPSAWSGFGKTMEFNNAGCYVGNSGSTSMQVGANNYFNGTNYIYSTTNVATRYAQSAGSHQWYTAASGTAGNAISFTQAMTLDASGRLGIGTTSPSEKLHLEGSGSQYMRVKTTTTNADMYFGITSSSVGYVGTGGSDPLAFYTGGTERARIDSSGNLLVGTTSASVNTFLKDSANDIVLDVANSSSSNCYGLRVRYSAVAPNTVGYYFYRAQDNAATRFEVYSNGGIANYSGNNVNLSDRREKTNFAPAKSYLDVICSIPVQTFNYIDQNMEDDGGLTLGVVAQDVQAVAPELVMESNWASKDEAPKMRLSVYQTDLQYALMKALQELKAEFDAYKASHP